MKELYQEVMDLSVRLYKYFKKKMSDKGMNIRLLIENPEDLCGFIFSECQADLNNFNSNKSGLYTYLSKVIYFRVVDKYNEEVNDVDKVNLEDLQNLLATAETSATKHYQIIDTQFIDRLYRLKKRQKMLAKLYYQKGISIKRLSELLKTTEQNMEDSIERINKHIHKTLNDKLDFFLYICVDELKIEKEEGVQITNKVIRYLDFLPPKQADIIYLMYQKGLSKSITRDKLKINGLVFDNQFELARQELYKHFEKDIETGYQIAQIIKKYYGN